MTDTQIVLQVFAKVLKCFFPVVLLFIIGLAILAVSEKSDKHKKTI